jgi:transcriptional regulator with XRE-family HTH domain
MSERFSDWLASQLTEKGIDMAELSRRSGVSTAYLSMLRKGTRTNPTPEKLMSISSALATDFAKESESAESFGTKRGAKSHQFRMEGLEIQVLMSSSPPSIQINLTGKVGGSGLEFSGANGAAIDIHGDPATLRCQVVSREGEDILVLECPINRLQNNQCDQDE